MSRAGGGCGKARSPRTAPSAYPRVLPSWVLTVPLLLGGAQAGLSARADPTTNTHQSWHLSVRADRLSVQLDRVPLGLVLAELARQSGFRVHLSEGVETAEVSNTFGRLPLDEGIERLLAGWPHAVLYAPGAAEAGGTPVRRIAQLVVLSPAGPASRAPQAGGEAGLDAALASPDPQVRIQATVACPTTGLEMVS